MKTCVYCLQPIKGEAQRLVERPKPGKRVEYVHPGGCPRRCECGAPADALGNCLGPCDPADARDDR